MTDKIFQSLCYLGVLFVLVGCAIAVPELYYRSENLISKTGIGLFFAGIGMSLISLSPKKEFSKGEIKTFSSLKRIKLEYAQHLFWFFATILMGTFFFTLKLFAPDAPEDLLSQFRDVGCGTFSLAVGFVCDLKSKRERYQQFQAAQINETHTS